MYELLVELLKKSNVFNNHVHCWSTSPAAFMRDIDVHLEKAEIDFKLFNCLEWSIDNVIEKFDDYELTDRYWTFFLLNFETFCRISRTSKDILTLLLRKFQKSPTIKLVTISSISWSSIQNNFFRIVFSVPVQLRFCNEDDVSTLIKKEFNVSNALLDLIYNLTSQHYRKPRLLLHIVRRLNEECERRGICITSDVTHKLFGEIATICNEMLKNDSAFSLNSTVRSTLDETRVSQFPALTKCAIIAAYCASYNPASSDQKFFFKGSSDRYKKRANASSTREKFHETGPRPFDSQRGLFIFTYFWSNCLDDYARANGSDIALLEQLNVDFNAQISILLSTGIVQSVSAAENIDEPKYRCLCSFSMAYNVAKSLKLDLKTYLADFASEI